MEIAASNLDLLVIEGTEDPSLVEEPQHLMEETADVSDLLIDSIDIIDTKIDDKKVSIS